MPLLPPSPSAHDGFSSDAADECALDVVGCGDILEVLCPPRVARGACDGAVLLTQGGLHGKEARLQEDLQQGLGGEAVELRTLHTPKEIHIECMCVSMGLVLCVWCGLVCVVWVADGFIEERGEQVPPRVLHQPLIRHAIDTHR